MVFYKGAVSYNDLQSMPLPELFKLQEFAVKIAKSRDK